VRQPALQRTPPSRNNPRQRTGDSAGHVIGHAKDSSTCVGEKDPSTRTIASASIIRPRITSSCSGRTHSREPTWTGTDRSALQELKAACGGVRVFVDSHLDRFRVKTGSGYKKTHLCEFVVGLTAVADAK
jgi:hypothetical protein